MFVGKPRENAYFSRAKTALLHTSTEGRSPIKAYSFMRRSHQVRMTFNQAGYAVSTVLYF